MAQRKGIELQIYSDPLIPWLYTDPVRLRQILFNLVGNAVKFTGDDQRKPGQIVIFAESRSLPNDKVAVEIRRRLILVAEDNETNQKVFVHQIRILGHRCEIVDNGRTALQRWRQGEYALVLTDCHMPEMDGYELARAIRREEGEHRRTPIIAITADALNGTKERCVAAGMDDYLPKPIQLHELREKLKQWLPPAEASDGMQKISTTDMLISDSHVVDSGALTEVFRIEDKALLVNFYLDFLRTGNSPYPPCVSPATAAKTTMSAPSRTV